MEWIPAYMLLGAIGGVLAGLLGVGGGVVVVPALAYLFHLQGISPENILHYAVATSLATIILTSLSSVRAHHRRGAIMWPVFRHLTPGLIAGSVAGALFADTLSSNTLLVILGVVEVLIGIQILTAFSPGPCAKVPTFARLTAVGLLVGGLATMVGVGGGVLIVPFLLWCNTPVHNAVATSSACSLPVAAVGAATYVLAGIDDAGLSASVLGYIHVPAFLGITATSILAAPLGAYLSHKLPVVWLRRMFAVFLTVVGVRLLVAAF